MPRCSPLGAFALAGVAAGLVDVFNVSITSREMTDVETFYKPFLQEVKESIFMNWGYAPAVEPYCRRLFTPGTQQYACQLYAHLLNAATMQLPQKPLSGAWAGKRTLEVGCGRCAGSVFAATEARPTQHVALDLMRGHLDVCRAAAAAAGASNLQLVHGSALNLPFEANRFDVVFNVESSHMYADWSQFACHVHRVLQPGGVFAWTDIGTIAFALTKHHHLSGLQLMESMRWLLEQIGFDVLVVEDIGLGVKTSLRSVAANDPTTVNFTLKLERADENDHVPLPYTRFGKDLNDAEVRYPLVVSMKRARTSAQDCSPEDVASFPALLTTRLEEQERKLEAYKHELRKAQQVGAKRRTRKKWGGHAWH